MNKNPSVAEIINSVFNDMQRRCVLQNRMIRLLLCAVLSLCTGATEQVLGQVVGKVTDETNMPLPYAAVYVEGTSEGTVTNAEGMYVLDLPTGGEYSVTFQYVGYRKETRTIKYAGRTVVQDIVLRPDEIFLDELVISDQREDPAYEILRKAIKKREYYREKANSFEADLYVKGVVKILSIPEEILGKKIGSMGGMLDSARQGIIYLSESKSKFYCLSPDETKEIMVSSIRSEGNSLFTANQFSWASFDLYNEYLTFSRTIVSPLADASFSHYRFQLEGAIIDPKGRMVNKIKVLPKSANAPLMEGHIYITEDIWNIHSTDLRLYGTALKNTFIDTIWIKQVYVPVENPDNWKLFSQAFSFNAGLMGLKVGGNFTYMFSNYKTGVDVRQYFKNNERFKVEASALNRDTAFWEQTRPIPLTAEESADYRKKDSLQRIWNSDVYRDSLDKTNNKLGWLDLLSGYTYSKSRENIQLTIPSPLSVIRFNALEGFKTSLEARWEKEDSLLRKWRIQPGLDYGFSDKTFKPQLEVEYVYDNYHQGKVRLYGGIDNVQFEPREPINERNNTWNSLWNKENRIRMYRHNYARVEFEREVSNGLYLTVKSGYSDRQPLAVRTHYSFRLKDVLYAENIPRKDLNPEVFGERRYWKNDISLLIRPGQTYSSYPNVKVRNISDWPNIFLNYEYGIPLDKETDGFQKLTVRIRDEYVNLRLAGYVSYNIEMGARLFGNLQHFSDFFHPMGNELLTPIDPDLSSFNLMPYYEFSTDSYYLQTNIRQHFNGILFDKIPLINKTGIKEVIGGGIVYTPDHGIYSEVLVGIENIRVGPLQLLDIDYTWAFESSTLRDHGITFRLSQFFKN